MAVEQAGVKVITGHRLDYVDHDQAIIVDRFGNKKELKADGGNDDIGRMMRDFHQCRPELIKSETL